MKNLNWEYVNYLVKPYLEDPSMKVVNINVAEDENGIITVVAHIAPVVEVEPQQRTVYAEGRL